MSEGGDTKVVRVLANDDIAEGTLPSTLTLLQVFAVETGRIGIDANVAAHDASRRHRQRREDDEDEATGETADSEARGDEGKSQTFSRGVAVVNEDGQTVSYTPPCDFVGVDTFGYLVADERGGVARGLLTVEVYALPPGSPVPLRCRKPGNGGDGTGDNGGGGDSDSSTPAPPAVLGVNVVAELAGFDTSAEAALNGERGNGVCAESTGSVVSRIDGGEDAAPVKADAARCVSYAAGADDFATDVPVAYEFALDGAVTADLSNPSIVSLAWTAPLGKALVLRNRQEPAAAAATLFEFPLEPVPTSTPDSDSENASSVELRFAVAADLGASASCSGAEDVRMPLVDDPAAVKESGAPPTACDGCVIESGLLEVKGGKDGSGVVYARMQWAASLSLTPNAGGGLRSLALTSSRIEPTDVCAGARTPLRWKGQHKALVGLNTLVYESKAGASGDNRLELALTCAPAIPPLVPRGVVDCTKACEVLRVALERPVHATCVSACTRGTLTSCVLKSQLARARAMLGERAAEHKVAMDELNAEKDTLLAETDSDALALALSEGKQKLIGPGGAVGDGGSWSTERLAALRSTDEATSGAVESGAMTQGDANAATALYGTPVDAAWVKTVDSLEKLGQGESLADGDGDRRDRRAVSEAARKNFAAIQADAAALHTAAKAVLSDPKLDSLPATVADAFRSVRTRDPGLVRVCGFVLVR